MKAKDVFQVCLDRYRECRTQLDLGKITAINPAACAKTDPRPESPRVLEYVLDFELAGKEVLTPKDGKQYPERHRLFQLYYCQDFPYQEVRDILGSDEPATETTKAKRVPLPLGTFLYWCQEIKHNVGQELRRRHVFPPSAYFREPTKLQQERSADATKTNTLG